MSSDRLWGRLLEFLNNWSTASEVEPGQITVTLAETDGSTRVVHIVMTAEEWDDMVCSPFGDFDAAAQEVRDSVLRLGNNEGFLVYESYELVPSDSAALPVDPEEVRLDELARLHPEGFGRWVALDGDGNVEDEFTAHQG